MKPNVIEESVQFGKRRIPYHLHRVNRKHLRIAISPDLRVDVYSPKSSSDQQVKKAILQKASWIARILDKIETYHPLPSPKKYISGETFIYLGRHYRLKVREGKNQSAKLQGRFLWVQVTDKQNRKSVRRIVEAWYREHAQQTFQRYLKQCYVIASRHGVDKPTISIRSMKRRWGSCTQAGRITLNVKLIQVPVHCIEYVIMHELCHLKHHNHDRGFYSLLTRCMPDWRWRKQSIDQIALGCD